MRNIFFTDESVKRQITDSISENLTDSDLESTVINIFAKTLGHEKGTVNGGL